MADFMKKIEELLATSTFKALLNADFITVQQICAAQSLLIQFGIPYDLTFSPGTRRLAAAAEFTIYINPTTTLSFVFAFEAGGSIFRG